MNHKRGRAKNRRAGCLMCKPNKMNGAREDILGHTGFGKLRDNIHSKADLKEYSGENWGLTDSDTLEILKWWACSI